MRTLQVVAEDGPEAVVLADVPEPDGDTVIRVRAAGVSFPDLLMTRGEYQLRQLGGQVDLIVDLVGGNERFRESLRALAAEGRIVVGFASGESGDHGQPAPAAQRRRARLCLRDLLRGPGGPRAAVGRLLELVGTGSIRPMIGAVHTLEDGRGALRALAAGMCVCSANQIDSKPRSSAARASQAGPGVSSVGRR